MNKLKLSARWNARDGQLKHLVILMSGTVFSAGILIACTPLLSRLYTPEAFGSFAVFGSLLSTFLTAGSACYEMAIPLPKEEEKAYSLLLLSLILLSCVTVGLEAVTLPFCQRIATSLGCPMLAPYLWLLPIGLLVGGGMQASSYLALRNQAFRCLSLGRVSQGSTTTVVQLLTGIKYGGALGLVLGDVLGRLAGFGVLLTWIARRPFRITMQAADILVVARQYRRFPMYSVAANLLSSLATALPTVLLARYFGPEIAGFYALTYRVLRAPLVLLGQAVSQTFFAKAAVLAREPDALKGLTERTAVSLFLAGFPIFVYLAFDGSSVFSLLFGQKWSTAGLYAQLLAPWFLIWLVANPLNSLLTVREWQATSLLYSFLECSIQAAALWVGAWFHSALLGIGLLGAMALVFSLIALARFCHAGYSSLWILTKRVAKPLVLTVAIVFSGIYLVDTKTGPGLILRLLTVGSLYIFILWRSPLLRKHLA